MNQQGGDHESLPTPVSTYLDDMTIDSMTQTETNLKQKPVASNHAENTASNHHRPEDGRHRDHPPDVGSAVTSTPEK